MVQHPTPLDGQRLTTAQRQADPDGHFRRAESKFRHTIPSPQFQPEADRYVLYWHSGCPWAHRTIVTRQLKGLENIIQLVKLDGMEIGPGKGWCFTGQNGGPQQDPLYGFKYLRQFYTKADATYEGRVTVPMLWDKKTETIVSNESSDIIRMFYSAFDELLPVELREETKGDAGLYPPSLRPSIDALNEWVYNGINNGVYKVGFAASQAAYDANIGSLFESLDRLEAHLASSPGPYLFGANITEADIRLFPTIVRFDVAYHTLFKCNIKMIRHDYPRIDRWLRILYWDESERTGGGAFKDSTDFDSFRRGYAMVAGNGIVPAGPLPLILGPVQP
ncbi:glutathione transferase [Phyllosticta capitalensis]|uniref:glutathione transferase n=1 Tax=Phyllosticta capitalensis TaxID=121624 RepID=UPI00312D4378